MEHRRIWSCLLLLLFGAASISALSAELRYVSDSTLSMEGTIVQGDSKKFREILLESPEHFLRTTRVEVNSEGGLVWEARNIADMIARSALMVTVPKDGQCASACFLLLAAAPIRLASGDVLIHRPYFSPDALKELSASEARARQSEAIQGSANFLRRQLVPEDLVSHILRTPSTHAYRLTSSDLDQLGIFHPSWDELIVAECGFSSRELLNGPTDVDTDCALSYGMEARYDYLWEHVSPEAAISATHKIEGSKHLQEPPSLDDNSTSSDKAPKPSDLASLVGQLWEEAQSRAEHFGVEVEPVTDELTRFEALVNHIWPSLTHKGDSRSALQLAMFYEKFFEQYRIAFRYRVLASQLGEPNALVMAGVAYEIGQGVERDIHKAYAYYSLAEDLGVQAASKFIEDLEKRNNLDGLPLVSRVYRDRIKQFLPSSMRE